MGPARHTLAAALLALATAAVFAPAVGNDFVAYDDDLYITEEPALRGSLAAGLRWAWLSHAGGNWFPLTRLSWLADASLFGLDPRAFHASSVAIHALASGLLALALARLTGAPGPSLFVAGVYALHPLRVESVAWAASRKDVLAGLFAALSLLAYERAARRGGFASHAKVALWLALGLLSKPVLVAWPFALLLLDAWPLGRLGAGGRLDPARLRAALREKWALFALCAAAAAATFAAQRAGGAVRSLSELPLSLRVANALASGVDTLAQSFWPTGLAVFYPHPGAEVSLAKVALGAALLLGVGAAGYALRRRQPWLPVGWLWFVVLSLPTCGIVQVGQAARADRYTLLPHIGLAIAVAWTALSLAGPRRAARLAVAGAGAAALAACALLSTAQLRVWRDSESLFLHALRVTEGNHVAQINLGMLRYREGRLDEASAHLSAGLRLAPGSAIASGWLGQVRLAQAREAEAIPLLLAALRGAPGRDDFRLALSTAMRARGRAADAVRALRAAPAASRETLALRVELASALVDAGDLDAARAELRAAAESAPGDARIPALIEALEARARAGSE
jgi:thioredoxin-like negative regulator of GroEL